MRLYLLLLLQVPEPTTVNGDSLGKAEDFRTSGPARVCIENAAIDLVAGENAYLEYAGIHSGRLRVISDDSQFDISHGEVWAKPKGRQTAVVNSGWLHVTRRGHKRTTEYLFYAPNDYSDGKYVLTLRVSGPQMLGTNADLQILSRINLYSDQPDNCVRSYHYGWDMLLGDEPLKTNSETEK